jgi:4a-hydroxytetrahydrobiopterin dehydratase
MPDTPPLARRHCVRCEPGTPTLGREEIDALLAQLEGWTVEEAGGHAQLTKRYRFKGFMPGVDLVNRIAAIAEAEGHHPDIRLSWGSVTVQLWTHAASGLTENDFILAARVDQTEASKS